MLTSETKIQANWFQKNLLAWYRDFGRFDLPWQHGATPYTVWLSEIMLQQTQVSTVIPYFNNFLAHFPDINTLANAHLDKVLSLWAGLGYYARARNLHKTAQIIAQKYRGAFPQNFDEIVSLPGIGRSTAGAILAQAFHQSFPILDGNVKRVLARFYGITKWPGLRETETTLWTLATSLTPKQHVKDYTQAIMDLGATLCTRSSPNCTQCPLQKRCMAFSIGSQTEIPAKKPKRDYPTKSINMLFLISKKALLLEKRQPKGIWGGLFCTPEFASSILSHWLEKNQLSECAHALSPLRHKFTHFQLNITPWFCKVAPKRHAMILKDPVFASAKWIKLTELEKIGMPTPIKRICSEANLC